MAWAAVLRLLRRGPEAEAQYRQVLARDPGHEDAAYELGMTLLTAGRMAEAWPFYDHRPIRRKMLRQSLSFPEWRGEPLAGKRLFLFREQGFGDQIMMARFLPRLGAAQITYLGPPQLRRLFAGLPVTYRDAGEGDIRIESHDYWSLPCSLPRWLTGVAAEAASEPYLFGQAAGRGARIGVVWRGEPLNPNDIHRSLPQDLGARLLTLPGAISLDPQDTGARDFQATADIIAGLDLVITADTAVSHLAGAMGRPVWVMLARHALDWQWPRTGPSPWYPKARLFVQPKAGDWPAVVDAVMAEASRP
jgi:hypothetical protein